MLAILAAACSATSSSSSATEPTPQHDAGPQPGPGPTPPYPADDATSMVVGVDVEDFRQTIGVNIETVHIVAKVDGQVAADQTVDLRSGGSLPHETTLKAPKGNKSAAVDVTVEGMAPLANGEPPPDKATVARLVSTRFVPDEARVIPIRLEARCAQEGPQLLGGVVFLGPTCQAPQTCVAAKCVNDVVAPESLPKYSKTWADDMPDACRAGSPSMNVGTGDADYVALTDGDTVKIVEGPQCGHHIWIGVNVAGLRQYGSHTFVSSSQPESPHAGPDTEFNFSYGDAGGGVCSISGIRYTLDAPKAGGGTWRDFMGKPLDIKVRVTDTTNKSLERTIRVNVAPTYDKNARPCS